MDYFFNLTTYVTSEVYLQLNNPNQGELAVVGSPIFKITPADWNRTRAISVEVRPCIARRHPAAVLSPVTSASCLNCWPAERPTGSTTHR